MTSDEIKATIERLEALVRDRDNMPLVHEVADAFVGADGYGLRNMLVDLLRQADPDTHMPLPLDVYGVPIHVGDRLCGCGHDDEVYCQAIVNGSVIAVGKKFSRFKEWEYWNVGGIGHYEEPTIEGVLREMLEKAVGFSDAHTTVALNVVDEYAKKLREMMANDEQ